MHKVHAPAVDGATNLSQVHVIDLEKLPEEFRLQRLTFKAARKAFEELGTHFRGTREYLVLTDPARRAIFRV